MIREQRIQFILEQLNKNGVISIEELTNELKVSRSTVHRDLGDLEAAKELQCIRGGAVSLNRKTSQELPFSIRKDIFLEEKQRIAQVAASMVSRNETLLLDSGTTIGEFTKHLADFKDPCYIATNDLQSAMALSGNANIVLTVLGGLLRQRHFSLNGYFTENMIEQIHADKVFMGVDAIDLDIGCMNFSVEEVQTKRRMVQAAKKVIVLCDHSKFESIAFVNICPLSDVDLIITGKEINPDILHNLREQGIQVETV